MKSSNFNPFISQSPAASSVKWWYFRQTVILINVTQILIHLHLLQYYTYLGKFEWGGERGFEEKKRRAVVEKQSERQNSIDNSHNIFKQPEEHYNTCMIKNG